MGGGGGDREGQPSSYSSSTRKEDSGKESHPALLSPLALLALVPGMLQAQPPRECPRGSPLSWRWLGPGPVHHHSADPLPRGNPGPRLVEQKERSQRRPADSTLPSGSSNNKRYFRDHQVQLKFRWKPPFSASSYMPPGTGSLPPSLATHSIWGKV